jgi:low temperature requirement protein LtrA
LIELSPTCAVEVEILYDKPTDLYVWPEIRQTWSDKETQGELELKPAWDELFYDLVIVASVGQIATLLRWREGDQEEGEGGDEDFSPSARILHFVLLFASLFNVWANFTGYNSRIRTNSLAHSSFLFLKMAAAAGMGANIEKTSMSFSYFLTFASFAWFLEGLSELEVYLFCHAHRQTHGAFKRVSGQQAVVLFLSSLT